MSDPTPSIRDWVRPDWVDSLLLNRSDAMDRCKYLESVPQYEQISTEPGRKRWNIKRLLELRRAAEVQSFWLETELDRLKKERAMLSAGKDPYIEEKSRLQDEQEDKFVNDFLKNYSSLSDEEIEHYDDKIEARNEIRNFEKLIKEGKEEILKVEQEITEIKAQQKV